MQVTSNPSQRRETVALVLEHAQKHALMAIEKGMAIGKAPREHELREKSNGWLK